MAIAFEITLYALPVLLTLPVSIIYFRNSGNLTLAEKILVSSHGAAISAVYCVALAIGFSKTYQIRYEEPFEAILIILILATGISMYFFQGKRTVHLLQLMNLTGMYFAYRIGVIAVTGQVT